MGTDALAAEVKGVGYVIYVDKEDYAKATKIFEDTYNTNVVVKLKANMSKEQNIEYGMAKGRVDHSGIDKFLGVFSIFGGHTTNPCQSNCPGISYINLTGDLSGIDDGLATGKMNAKLSVSLPDFITNIKDKKSTEVERVVTDEYGNTYKVKDKTEGIDDLASGKISEASKNGNSGNASNAIKPEKAF